MKFIRMSKNCDLKIFVFHYKPGPVISLGKEYIPMWAGKNNSTIHTGLDGDDTGDHISHKNKYYSELTGIYWAWKNSSSDIVGSCHYRRYFTNVQEPFPYRLKRIVYYLLGLNKKRYGLIYTNNIGFWKNKIVTQNEICEILKDYDAIMPLRRKFKYSLEEHYRRYHDIDDIKLVKVILKEFSPAYVSSFDQLMNQKRLFANNMFILKKETFEALMKWLFHILFEIEKKIDLNNYKDYQERIFGFLSERLITLWFYHNKINYKELPLIYFKRLKK